MLDDLSDLESDHEGGPVGTESDQEDEGLVGKESDQEDEGSVIKESDQEDEGSEVNEPDQEDEESEVQESDQEDERSVGKESEQEDEGSEVKESDPEDKESEVKESDQEDAGPEVNESDQEHQELVGKQSDHENELSVGEESDHEDEGSVGKESDREDEGSVDKESDHEDEGSVGKESGQEDEGSEELTYCSNTLENHSEYQDFCTLRRDCRSAGVLYEDPYFPANYYSIGKTGQASRHVRGQIRWKRPTQITSQPKFVTDGYSQFDVVQGYLGDCWFASSCASLTTHPELFERVVPRDNKDFDDHRYVGLFHFYFCDGNQWVEIKIDDRLPVDENDELIYMKSSVQNEFWAALVEKAYAKLHGSYEALIDGTGESGMFTLTGGITAYHRLNGTQPHNLFEILETYLPQRTLATCAIHKNDQMENVIESVGLRQHHEYSVLRVSRLYNVKLICVRNPWGRVEWCGDWSDHSPKWNQIPYEERMQLLAIKDNGEFWMSFYDFERFFDAVTICHQTQ